jgi:cystathionine beta-synthase/cysteine synthase A
MVDTPDEHGGFQRPRLDRVQELLARHPDAFWPDQYNNPENPRAHAEVTATELLADVPHFDALITAVSTGGHLSGLSATVKRMLPEVVTVGVDAEGSAAFGYPPAKYAMRGLGLAWQPGNLDRALVDRLHRVADQEGIETMHVLARTEGVLVGESGGAAVFAALHHAHRHPGSRIVVVAADGGTNYFEDYFTGYTATGGDDPRRAKSALTDLIAAAATPRHPQAPLDPTEGTVRGRQCTVVPETVPPTVVQPRRRPTGKTRQIN